MADYDGGRVFLQVIPSFRGVQRIIAAEAKRWGQSTGRDFQQGFDQEVRRSRQRVGPTEAESSKQGADSGGAFASAFRRRVEAAMRALPPAELKADATDAERKLRDLRLHLQELSGKTIGIDLDAGTAMAELERIDQQLAELGRESSDVRVRVDAGAARGELAAIHAQVNNLDGDDVNIDVDVDTSSAHASLIGLGSHFAVAGSLVGDYSSRLLTLGAAGAALAPAIVPAAGAAAVAIAGIGAAAFVGLGGIAAAIIGFSGVGEAVKAMGAAQRAAGEEGARAGERQASAAAGIASAQRQLEQAEASLANTRANTADQAVTAARRVVEAQAAVAEAESEVARRTEDAARRVEDARRSVVDATEAAVDDLTAALRRQSDAEEALADAQVSTRQAQLDLTQAREDAQAALDDMALSTRSAALAEEDAELGLARARERFVEAIAEGATGLDLREAELSVRQAELRFDEARDRNQEARASAEEAQRAGVDGAEAVLAAEQRLADARDAEVDAQQRVQDATAATTKARVDGAERVADAERRLSDAVLEQQRAQIDGTERVAAAQQRVVDAIAAQEQQQRQSAFAVAGALASVEGAQAALAEASRQTAEVGSASMRKLQESMDGLGPAGQRFATFLFGLKPLWKELKAATEEALLPGVQAGMEALIPLAPQISALIASLGGAMGQLAQHMGESLASPAWKPFFDYLTSTGADTLVTLGVAFGDIALGFANLMVAFAPLSDLFVKGIGNMARSFAEWSAGLSKNSGFQAFLAYIRANLPVIMEFLGALGRAFVQLIISMAPFGPIILGILTNVLNFIAGMDPQQLALIVLNVLGIVGAFKAMSLATSLLSANPILLIVVALVTAYTQSETFREIVHTAFAAVGAIATWLWEEAIGPAFRAISGFITEKLIPTVKTLWRDVIEPAFKGIADVVSWAWEHVIQPYLKAWWFYISEVLAPVVMWLWRNIVEPAFTKIREVIQITWGVIEIIFKAWELFIRTVLGPILSWLWRNVVEPAFNGIGKVVSDTWAFIRPIFEALGGFIEETVVPAFRRGVDALKLIWDGLKAIAAAPVNFVIDTIYNNGIRKVFNKIAGIVGADELPEMQTIKLATGGIMPGYTPGRDVHRFWSPTAGVLELSGGEPVLRPEAGRVLGHSWVDGINAAARTGGTDGVRRFLHGYSSGGFTPAPSGGGRSFALGGLIDFGGDVLRGVKEGVAGVLAGAKDFVLGGLRKAAELAFAPIRAVLGELGDSGIAELLRGLVNRAIDGILDFSGKKDSEGGLLQGGGFGQFSRGWPARILGRVAANTAAAAAFVRESFGIRNIGTLGQRANKSDHPYGKALDVMIPNWQKPEGIAKGNAVASWFIANPDAFGTKYVIWRQQINSGSGWRGMSDRGSPTANHMDHPHISLYDAGGFLPPGLHTVANLSGRPEPILTPSQWDDLRLAAGRGAEEFHWHQEAPVFGVNNLQDAIAGALEQRDAELRRQSHAGRAR